VTSTHHPIHRIAPVEPRPLRCFRHRVWMAVCEDCRAAHADLLDRARKQGTDAN
jgi:hypothetical protein